MSPEDDGILIKSKPLRDLYLARITRMRREREDLFNAANVLQGAITSANDFLDDIDRAVDAAKTDAEKYHDKRDPV